MPHSIAACIFQFDRGNPKCDTMLASRPPNSAADECSQHSHCPTQETEQQMCKSVCFEPTYSLLLRNNYNDNNKNNNNLQAFQLIVFARYLLGPA